MIPLPNLTPTESAALSPLLLLALQWLAARFGVPLAPLPPAPAPAPAPDPGPLPSPPIVPAPGGGLLARLLALLPWLLQAKAKNQLSAEEREAVRLIRAALPPDEVPRP